MKMQSVLRDWTEHAAGHASNNLAFLNSLGCKTEKVVDRAARRLHREAFAIIDCTRCANCCKAKKSSCHPGPKVTGSSPLVHDLLE